MGEGPRARAPSGDTSSGHFLAFGGDDADCSAMARTGSERREENVAFRVEAARLLGHRNNCEQNQY